MFEWDEGVTILVPLVRRREGRICEISHCVDACRDASQPVEPKTNKVDISISISVSLSCIKEKIEGEKESRPLPHFLPNVIHETKAVKKIMRALSGECCMVSYMSRNGINHTEERERYRQKVSLARILHQTPPRCLQSILSCSGLHVQIIW